MEQKRSFFQSKRNVVLTAIFYTFLWGSAFPLVKICMENFQIPDADNMSKCLVAGIRFTCAGMLTLLWCLKAEKTGIKLGRKQIKYVLSYGILGTALQYGFTYIGLSRVDGSKGAIFDQACVFFIILTGGLLFRDDRLNWYKIAGCVLGFLGVLAINKSGMDFSFHLNGEGIMLGAAILQTIAYFIAKSAADTISAPKLVGYGQFTGGILLSIFALLSGGKITAWNMNAWITLTALTGISAVAYVLSLIPLKYFPASEVSSFNLLITVFGVVMSGIMLGENIWQWNYAVSLLLIAAGILLVNYKRNKKENP